MVVSKKCQVEGNRFECDKTENRGDAEKSYSGKTYCVKVLAEGYTQGMNNHVDDNFSPHWIELLQITFNPNISFY